MQEINVIRECGENQSGSFFVRGIFSLPLGETKEPRGEDDQDEVEDEEREQHPSVSPPVLVPDVQRGKEVFSNGVRAISATGGIARVIEVSTKRRHELGRPSVTRLTLRRLEHGELLRRALDLETVKFRGDHRAHDPSERIEVVQPRPRPPSNIGVRNRDTTEGREDGDDERVEQDGDLDARRDGADELGEGDTKQLDEDDNEELESGSVDTRGTLTESHGVDHENPVQDGA